ncbi:3-phosphoserine/phosphohydroxythreonine transaminase [Avibacterium paragallinarum]|uniref:3-phosphoserine/phosphohydroxythreonine transaminase n=1 Tax=Avibacterium paragallinarum TaxID=728 RepID=UPI00021AD57E|nr:3-phosphoserine/phosphohydroxythreonine transaminase [Avibacterium paragallinarum]AZI13832.1 3-phosphoserine/phosphohydroxythreonine transaminase [Avibacterium paragallinarum]QIR11848.1 3-phosphoserine/phosphohydroxythreonine transaminase [Avibacterium paragallinarum]QJE09733.1 3-phosphoserine/phosphohydroxythreonine transaminase [Avibacterium paragallinarum]QJE11929.1 3-phosphoserine/phosphohydroxythreonine transaminase [Avibacterium paragallinarum]QJE14127.1 3-phosphoserine/phosphohydroxy
MTQVFNFSAGPAMMPREVLEQAQAELLNWQGQHTSVMEVSHRGKLFMELITQAEKDFRTLYHIPDNYKILFLQGGARGQFAAVPMNLIGEKGKALYLTSGHWSATAAKEARLFCEVDEINILAEGEELKIGNLDFSNIAEQYDYVHYCPNETISGVEIFDVPKVGNAVLVADMSSNILSREIDINQFGIIYAGAQKNLGPAGITIVIVREDLIGKARKATPSIWNYEVQANSDSMINTPPTFAWYLCSLVFKYLLERGGVKAAEKRNQEKAQLLYDYLDQSDFYHNSVAKNNRSLMNVTFTTGNDELNMKFVSEATEAGLQALKGHKVIGGMRASIYNAMPIEGVQALIAFMEKFAAENR